MYDLADKMTDNNNPQQEKRRNNESEHETHTTSLVLLALATLVIVGVVLSMSQSSQSLSPGNYDQEDITVSENQPSQESHGSVIPTTNIQSEKLSDYTGFPEGLINIPDSAEVLQNVSASIGEGKTMRTLVILRNKQSPPALLYGQYHEWLDASRFDITDTTGSATTYTIDTKAENGDSVTVKISAKTDGVRVQINYLTQN